jgi:hypothetical protein
MDAMTHTLGQYQMMNVAFGGKEETLEDLT